MSQGVTVTFDSYPKADGSRKSEYGNYNNESGYENVIDYSDGVTIDHIMASGALPEFYNHAEVSIHTSDKQKTHFVTFGMEDYLAPLRELCMPIKNIGKT